MSYQILQGNCIDLLKDLQEKSINTCITSPPYYGLRDYGIDNQLGREETIDEFVNNLVEVFQEVRRVLRDDGTVWLNLGDSYGGQRGKGFNTHQDKGGKNRVQELQKEHGDLKVTTGLPLKSLLGIPWRVALALQADGWILRQDIIWHKPNPMPESCRDRCTKAHEYIFLLSKKQKYYYDHEAIKEPSVFQYKGRYGPVKPSSVGNKNKELPGFEIRDGLKNMTGSYPMKNKRSVWTVTTKPCKEAHFATFPIDLIEPCVLAGSPEEGIVLDPFGGSGTTTIAAEKHKRNSILLEINPEYIEIAKARIKKYEG